MTRASSLAILLALGVSAIAAPSLAQPGAARIDPDIATALAGRYPPAPFLAARGASVARDRADVIIELRSAASRAEAGGAMQTLAQLASEGVALRAPEGTPIAWGRWVPARIDARGLRALSRVSGVAAVHLAPRSGILPLDRSAERIGLAAARGASMGVEQLTGAGVTIADIDSAIDVFHPTFFRADAGWFDWIDVDRNGRFAPDVDAIDLDRDGEADGEEIAHVLRAAPIDLSGGSTAGVRPAGFDPGIDWLFLDVDADGMRDVGESGGFDDTAPALGEPLFVPDDVDGDGVLDPEERVARLGSSKLRSYYVSVSAWGPSTEHVYRRGVDLAQARRDYTGGAHGYSDTLHGSGVAGIVVGDVPLVGRRWVGIAPDADLVHAFQLGQDSTGVLAWTLGENPDVVLHEYVTWTRTPVDGSDPLAQMIDDSTMNGNVAHVCPAGNIGGARKHAQLAVVPGTTAELGFQLASPLQYMELTIHDPAETATTLVLVEPNGTEHPFDPSGGELSNGADVWMSEVTTTRGQHVRTFTVYDTMPVVAGDWRVRVSVPDTATAESMIHGFLADENGFALGAAWMPELATDRSTIAWPATADSCLGVGAVPSHTADEGPWYAYAGDEPATRVRAYSARGPRIDGFASLGIAAPDNPWSALGAGDIFPSMPGIYTAPEGAFQVFGGTSGAGPHVAGVVALLAARGVRGTAALDAVRRGAITDGIEATLPDQDYGAGILSASGALGVSRNGTAPQVTLRAEPMGTSAPTSVQMIATATDEDGGALEFRWDEGYDGTWDSEYAASTERTLAVETGGMLRVKVRVRDATGRIGEAVAQVIIEDAPLDGGAGDAGTMSAGGSGCGCRIGARSDGSLAALAVGMLAALMVGRRRRSRVIAKA